MKKTLTVLGLAVLMIAATVAVAGGADFDQAASGCVDDPIDQDDPRGEVLRFCAAVADGQASFGIDVQEVLDPNADPAWTSSFSSNWAVDVETTGDTEPDYRLRYANEEGFGASVEVFDLGDFSTTCSGTASFEVSRYVASALPVADCFDGTATFRATSTFTFNQDEPFVLEIDDSPAVTPGTSLPAALGGGSTPPPPPPPPSGDVVESFRLEGPSRFETAIAIAQFQFPNGSTDVYLSRSDEFADSISSGSLTGGPILLVPSCGPVPSTVLAEVERLAPQRVIALGGVAAVCDQVLADVTAAAQG